MRSSKYAGLTAVLALLGCGGGGGGNTQRPVDTRPQVSVETLDASGVAITGSISIDQNTGSVTSLGIGTPEAASLSLTATNGQPTVVTIGATGKVVSFDSARGDSLTRDNGVGAYETVDGRSVAIIVDPTSASFAHQSFGSWLTGLGSNQGEVGVGSFGKRTPVEKMPTGVSAQYHGATTGIEIAGGEASLTASAVEIETDFSVFSINTSGTSRIDTVSLIQTPAPDLDISGSGTVSGSGLSGTVSGNGLSGTVSGSFFGGNADEVGGVFSSSGGGRDYVGSFGAKR